MNKITPFLWFNDNAEDAAEFYLSVFPEAKKLGEGRSSGVGPWPTEKMATITSELLGQQMTCRNGGPAHALTPAFSYSVACKDQAEIDRYWDKLLDGGKPMACGWLTDKFGLCWQIVPERIGEILKHPNAMAAMMKMVKRQRPKTSACEFSANSRKVAGFARSGISSNRNADRCKS